LEALTSALPDTPPLARANLAAHLAYRGPSEAIVRMLIEAYDDIAQDELTAVINAERAVRRLPRVAPDLVEEVLAALRERHLDAVQAAIVAAPHPGRLMTRLVEQWIDAERPARDFLEALTERYDRWSAPILGRVEERMDAAIDRLRAQPKDGEALEEIVRALVDWDEHSQPRQLLFGQKRLDEPRSRKLAEKLRSLAVWIANERQEYQRALVITKALLVTFPELPGVDAKLRKDFSALQELIRQTEEVNLLAELTDGIETARACPTLGRELKRGDFGPEGAGVAGRLYAAFAKAARRAVGHEHADLPWQALRQLAIELHNEHKETEAARRLITAIRSFTKPEPSPEIADQLREDEATLRSELLWRDIGALVEARRWAVALDRLRALEALAADATQRQKITGLRREIGRRRSGTVKRRMAWAAMAALLGVVWLANLESGPPAPRAASPTGRTASAGGAETAPPVGRDRRLTRDQIRYCLFQGERIEAFRLEATTNAQIARFNRLVDDWNSRCSSYGYRPPDMQAVEREVGAQKDRLQREGRRLAIVETPSSPPSLDPYAAVLEFRPGEDEPFAPSNAPSQLLSPATSTADGREVQGRLAALGLYTGAIDGIWGAASRSALIEFKRGAGLPANPDWDRATQTTLFQATDR
jgi:Putative peptidoglycan binding domain